MNKKIVLITMLFCLGIFAQQTIAQVSLRNYDTTFRAYPQRDKPHWGWTPSVSFKLNGPVSGSLTASVEYTLPDGKPWVTADCMLQSRDSKVVTIKDCGEKIDAAKKTFLTGMFGYKIKISDELEGKTQVLQTGKIKVGKFLYNPGGDKEFNQQFYYYLDNDWRLPMAFIYPVWDDGEYQEISVDMWFKGKAAEYGDYAGFLYHDGKQIETRSSGGIEPVAERALETNPFEYHKRSIRFSANITCTAPGIHGHPGSELKKNPGEYEFKIIHNGKLVRSVKFNIGADGFPVDNGIAQNSNFGNKMVIVPVSVLGTLDGTWNKTAWQTEAFWGNPLKGFTALP